MWKRLVPVVAIFVVLPLNAQAYIDPNTGGFFFQLLFPVFAFFITMISIPKKAFARVWAWMKSRLGKKE